VNRSSEYEGMSLDPEDWDPVRADGSEILRDVIDHFQARPQRKVWTAMPRDVEASLRESPPLSGDLARNVYHQFRDSIMPYDLGNTHPRFWGWVIGSGTVYGAFAELLTAALNINAAGFRSAAVAVEDVVLGWFKTVMGFPGDAGGILTTGGSDANLYGIAAGLYRGSDAELIRSEGVRAVAPKIIYTSDQSHFSVRRAARLLGLGESAVRVIQSVDYMIDMSALQRAVDADRAAGLVPAIVVAHAGTVGTGAIDPLATLSDFTRKEDLWLHVDGAFGAAAMLSPELMERVEGIGRADSLVIDFHKWLHVPIDAGCVLIRDPAAQRAAFEVSGPYLNDLPGGVAVGVNRFTSLGIQQSRSARSFKVWFTLKHYGLDQLGRMAYKNVRQADWLAELIRANSDLELLTPVTLNVVCFRHVGDHAPEELNDLNRAIVVGLHERGIAAPSHYVSDGKVYIRCAITNHRTADADLRALLDGVAALAAELALRHDLDADV
jgi:glutamate/tyrosine decarboxylase-like PLP-dependent enzyme